MGAAAVKPTAPKFGNTLQLIGVIIRLKICIDFTVVGVAISLRNYNPSVRHAALSGLQVISTVKHARVGVLFQGFASRNLQKLLQ